MEGIVGHEDKKPEKKGHKPFLAILIVFTFVLLIFAVALNYLSSTPVGKQSGIFLNSTGDVSDLHYLEITPAGWTFTIWLVIYLWQFVWMIYAFVGLFRKNPDGQPLYANPELQSPALYLVYIVNLGCNLAWMLLFDRQFIGWCLIPIALLAFTLYTCLVLSHMRLMQHGNHMTKNGMRKDIWMTRFFVQNGMAFYATWVSIACLLNLGMVLTYRAGLDQSLSSTICLNILMVEVASWFILDLFVFERYTRYLFSPYIVVCFALSGSLAKNYDPTMNNSIATVVLMTVAIAAGAVKVFMLFYRHCTRPIFNETVEVQDKEDTESTKL